MNEEQYDYMDENEQCYASQLPKASAPMEGEFIHQLMETSLYRGGARKKKKKKN